MRILPNILTIEVDDEEYNAMETTFDILNELYNALPSDSYDTKEMINDATECLSALLRNRLNDVAIHRE